jgi:heme exporter protein D
MNWGSAGEFFAMGGKGLYVWGSYLVTVVVIAAEIVILRRRGRTLRADDAQNGRITRG